MKYQIIDDIPVFGEPQLNAVEQMKNCTRHPAYAASALMADHHLGYAVPVGGVIAYHNAVSPSGVGFDIACGNKAVLTDMTGRELRLDIKPIMDCIAVNISFGVGRKNAERVEHDLFDDPAWEIPAVAPLKELAREQLGTVGSGNHYVDLFVDDWEHVWIGCHFGSRGLGHKIASFYIKEGGGKDGVNVDPVVLDADSELGKEYIAAMQLAGRYAYAGRDWVCSRVAQILGAFELNSVHNHHNFAWQEPHGHELVNGIARPQLLWVVRKGATPAFPGQPGFIGSTMGEPSYLVVGTECNQGTGEVTLYSTVHGAGRVMSRTEAAGKVRWKKGVKTRMSEGKVTPEMMDSWVTRAGVELRGGGRDESPDCYKRLRDVIDAQGDTIDVVHQLFPLGVAMAGANEHDPYKD